MKPKHFAGLDGLRFISITFVVLHHLFTFKSNFGLKAYDYPLLGTVGLYGIHFFFMGSGFLISYLLLYEQEKTGKIDLKNFFLRRLLRIWPGYYLLIVLALTVALTMPFFKIPGTTDAYVTNDPEKSNLLFFLFLPHIAPFFNSTAPFIHHTYTIGIEEQFYIMWGLLFYIFTRNKLPIFLFLFFSMPFLNVLHHKLYLYTSSVQHPTLLNVLKQALFYLKYSKISTFALGAIFGYCYFLKRSWIFYFRYKVVQLAVYILLIACIGFNVIIPFAQDELMAFLMACVMLIATFKENSIINYSASWIEFLGKISYGIYLFHIFAIVLAIKLLNGLFGLPIDTFAQVLLLCIVTLILSICFGWLSYNYFEIFFLKLKQRFRKI